MALPLVMRTKEFIRHHGRRIVRVGMVGAVGFFIQTLIFELLGIRLALVAASSAALIGGECALLSNFFLNDRFNFSDAAGKSAPLWQRLVRFHLVASGSLATQWIFIFTMEQFTHDDWLLRAAYVSGVGVGFLVNYTGYYFFVWRVHMRKPSSSLKSSEDV